jgi:archaellin
MSRDLYIKASSGSEEWQRPSDWLPMPTNITSANQTFVGLHAVIENADNYVAFLFTTSAGQYRVDWGDGTITLHNSNTIAQYQYNFATISNSTLTSRGYKQSMITVTAVSGNLLTCNFQQRFVTSPVQNQAYSTGFLDCILSMPNANTGQSIGIGGVTVRHTYCERFDIKTIGNCTTLVSLFNSFYSLQSLTLFNTFNVISFGSMFQDCFSLKKIPFFNTQNTISFNGFFRNCFSLEEIPFFNTNSLTDLSSCFTGCRNLKKIPLINTSNVTNFDTTFFECQSLNNIPALSTNSITPTSGVNFVFFALNSSSLNRCQMIFARDVNFNNCQLSRDAIVEIFTNLVNRTLTTSATIYISNNWGASALTAGERAIATNKNWVIVG